MTATDEQARIRGHIRNLLVTSIAGQSAQEAESTEVDRLDFLGGFNLQTWVAEAAIQKIDREIGLYYPTAQLTGTTMAKAMVRRMDLTVGAFYLPGLPGQRTLVLIRLTPKRMIRVLQTDPSRSSDRGLVDAMSATLGEVGYDVDAVAVVHIPFDSNALSDVWTQVFSDDPDATGRIRAFVTGLISSVIAQKSQRDKQRMPGPSDLADPCDLCVARKVASAMGMAIGQSDDGVSLKAWLGTAVHEKVERDLPSVYGQAEQEITVVIGEVDGLGVIKGHIDLYDPEVRVINDFKTTDLDKLDKIKRVGVPSSHAGQTMLYLRGVRRSGRKADHATLTYIPRDSRKLSDIWVASCAYREDIAIGLMNRTQHLVQVIRSGDTSALQSATDCFTCVVKPRLRR